LKKLAIVKDLHNCKGKLIDAPSQELNFCEEFCPLQLLTQLVESWFNALPGRYTFVGECPNVLPLRWSVTHVHRSIAPILEQRIKRRSLFQNPLHKAIRATAQAIAIPLQLHDPKDTGQTETNSALNWRRDMC